MKESLTYTIGNGFGIEKGPKLNFRLQTNPTLDSLATKLKSTRPDWDRLHRVISSGSNAGHGNGEFVGHLGEQHIQMVLEDTVDSSESVDLTLNPIKTGTKTKNFSFYVGSNGNLTVKDRKTNNDVTDYDSLMIVGGLPVVGAVRLSGTRAHKGQYLEVLNNGYINKALHPLREYFNTNTFGFLAIVPPEMIKGEAPELRFLGNGGILVPMAAKLDDFKEQSQPLQANGDRLRQQKNLEERIKRLSTPQEVFSQQKRKERRREKFMWEQKHTRKSF